MQWAIIDKRTDLYVCVIDSTMGKETQTNSLERATKWHSRQSARSELREYEKVVAVPPCGETKNADSK